MDAVSVGDPAGEDFTSVRAFVRTKSPFSYLYSAYPSPRKINATNPIDSVGNPGVRANIIMTTPTIIITLALPMSCLILLSAKLPSSLEALVIIIPVAVEIIRAGI